MRKRLAIGAMAVAAAAAAGCSSSGTHDTSATSPSRSATSQPPPTASSTGPATGTAACDAINQTLNEIMQDAAKATPPARSSMTAREAVQARLASNLENHRRAFTDDQAKAGITQALKQAEQTIAANVGHYYANYSKPSSGTYGLKIVNALGRVKQECGTAPWQTAI